MPSRGCRDLPSGGQPLRQRVVLAPSVDPGPPRSLAGGQEGRGDHAVGVGTCFLLPSVWRCSPGRTQALSPTPMVPTVSGE